MTNDERDMKRAEEIAKEIIRAVTGRAILRPMPEELYTIVLEALKQKERETLERVQGLVKALETCAGLFSEIRGDWTDPRYECREGQKVIGAALADFNAYKESLKKHEPAFGQEPGAVDESDMTP